MSERLTIVGAEVQAGESVLLVLSNDAVLLFTLDQLLSLNPKVLATDIDDEPSV